MRNIFQKNRQIGQFCQNFKSDNKLWLNSLAYLTNPKEKPPSESFSWRNRCTKNSRFYGAPMVKSRENRSPKRPVRQDWSFSCHTGHLSGFPITLTPTKFEGDPEDICYICVKFCVLGEKK
jgi:hypothetical protein